MDATDGTRVQRDNEIVAIPGQRRRSGIVARRDPPAPDPDSCSRVRPGEAGQDRRHVAGGQPGRFDMLRDLQARARRIRRPAAFQAGRARLPSGEPAPRHPAPARAGSRRCLTPRRSDSQLMPPVAGAGLGVYIRVSMRESLNEIGRRAPDTRSPNRQTGLSGRCARRCRRATPGDGTSGRPGALAAATLSTAEDPPHYLGHVLAVTLDQRY